MSIFPNFPSEVNLLIVSFLDLDSTIKLSKVNHRTYELLGSDSYFKKLFLKFHPHLKAKQDLLYEFSDLLPKQAWKIGCWISLNPLSRSIHSLSDEFLCESIKGNLKKRREDLLSTIQYEMVDTHSQVKNFQLEHEQIEKELQGYQDGLSSSSLPREKIIPLLQDCLEKYPFDWKENIKNYLENEGIKHVEGFDLMAELLLKQKKLVGKIKAYNEGISLWKEQQKDAAENLATIDEKLTILAGDSPEKGEMIDSRRKSINTRWEALGPFLNQNSAWPG